MVLLPQELIEAIIDHLPHPSLPSSSLTARRWRTRSQQRIFDSIVLSSQSKMNHWCSIVQRSQNRIVSYVHSVEFYEIHSWDEPELFGRVIRGFCSLERLKVWRCAIPEVLAHQISRGELGGGITTLSLQFPSCDLSTIISMVLSLPELKKLEVTLGGEPSIQSSSTSIASRGRSLDLLELLLHANEVAEVLIQSRFTFRHICLGSSISSVHRLLTISSKALVSLTLEGVIFTSSQVTEAMLTIFADTVTRTPISPIDLPSFPVLTSLRVRLYKKRPSHRIISVLSFVSSTPALISIDVQPGSCSIIKPTPSDTWDDLDGWLARVVRHTAVECGLVLNLRLWTFSKSSWEALFPNFREAGGEIKIHAN